jgi:hypothetical protein
MMYMMDLVLVNQGRFEHVDVSVWLWLGPPVMLRAAAE